MRGTCAALLVLAGPGLVQITSLAQEGAAPREIITPEEEAELERERKREAQAVLVCEPRLFSATVKQGETALLRLTVRNAGGSVLKWSILSAPKWLRIDMTSGSLGHAEERKLVLVAEPEGLPGGTAGGNIVIVAPDAKGSPASVPISILVREKPRPPAPEPVEVEPPRPETVPRDRRRPAPGPRKERRYSIGIGGYPPDTAGDLAGVVWGFFESRSGAGSLVLGVGMPVEPKAIRGTYVHDITGIENEYTIRMYKGFRAGYRRYVTAGRASFFVEGAMDVMMADVWGENAEYPPGTGEAAFLVVGGGARFRFSESRKAAFIDLSLDLLLTLDASPRDIWGETDPELDPQYVQLAVGVGVSF